MNWLEFSASIVNSLAWPFCVAVVVYFLKSELPNILGGINRLKYKDLEIDFEKSSSDIAARAKEALPPTEGNPRLGMSSLDEYMERFYAMRDLAPRAAILEAWLAVEAAAVDLVRKSGVSDLRSAPGPMRLRDYLLKAGVLGPAQKKIFEDLRNLRNEAVHAQDAQFTQIMVNNFIETAMQLAIYLEHRADGL